MKGAIHTLVFCLVTISSIAQSEITLEDSLINTLQTEEGVFVPNVFTPNGDGVNDQFRIVANNITEYNLTVFNRWGDLIFEGIAPEIVWDGRTFSGEKAPDGNYFYVLLARSSGADYSATGTVTLIR